MNPYEKFSQVFMSKLRERRVESDMEKYDFKKISDDVIEHYFVINKKTYKIKLIIVPSYPFNPPKIFFIDNFDHPYIKTNKEIMYDILQNYWSFEQTLINYLKAIETKLF